MFYSFSIARKRRLCNPYLFQIEPFAQNPFGQEEVEQPQRDLPEQSSAKHKVIA